MWHFTCGMNYCLFTAQTWTHPAIAAANILQETRSAPEISATNVDFNSQAASHPIARITTTNEMNVMLIRLNVSNFAGLIARATMQPTKDRALTQAPNVLTGGCP